MLRAAMLCAVGLVLLVGITASSVNKRAYVAGKFALEIDGALSVGFLKSVEGGGIKADVIEDPTRPGTPINKHIGTIKYEEIAVTCGTGMSRSVYDWIKASMDPKVGVKNGAIIATDYNLKEESRLEFTNALISEVTFPACDGSSKDAAKMTVKISPETTRKKAGSGQVIKGGGIAQQKWLPANFKLEIGGLDCTKVNKIEAITIKQKTIDLKSHVLECSDLVVTLPEAYAKTFYDWHEDFLIKGNSSGQFEKTGKLSYLSPDLKTPLFELELKGLGIFSLSPEKVEAGGENIRRVKAEMYCEQLIFSYSSPAGGETTP